MNRARAIRERLAGRKLLGRGRHSLTFEEPGGRRRVVQTPEPLHYSNGGDLLEVDTSWVPDGDHLKIAATAFSARAVLNLRPGEIMELEQGGHTIGYRPLPLYYANALSDLLDASTLQKLVDPKVVSGVVRGDRLLWAGAYGAGTTLEWRATPAGLQKWLELDSVLRLPLPLIPGPRHLVVPYAVRMPSLKAALAGRLLDMTHIDEAGAVQLQGDDGDAVFSLEQPYAYDAAGESVKGRLRFRRLGTSLVIAAVFPLSWLADPARVYPVRLDPSVTHDITVGTDDITAKPDLSSLPTFAALFVGTSNSSNIDWQMALRWPGLAIPQGAPIDSATETVYTSNTTSTPVNAEILCEATDNAAQITSPSNFFGRNLTAEKALWTPPGTVGFHITSDFKSALQAVVNRPGWASGNAMQTFHRDTIRNNAAVNRVTIYGYENDPASAPQLDVVYTDPVAPGPMDEIAVTLRPRISGDDGFTYNDGAGGARFNNGLTYLVVNDISSTAYDYTSFIRMTLDAGQVLPQGVTLKSATLIFTSSGGADSAWESKVSFQQTDNATAPATRSDILARQNAAGARVTLKPATVWNPEKEHHVDVTALVQAIVNRAGYNSGAMLALWEPYATGWGGSNNNHQTHSYDGAPAKTVRLEVIYYNPDPPVIGGDIVLL